MIEDRILEAESVARHILGSQFGASGAELLPKEDARTNYVVEAVTGHGPVVLRMGPAAEAKARFERERCVTARVRDEGIPAPEVMCSGESAGWAYMILRRMPGRPATNHPRRLEILNEAARAAATQIHRIRTIGFGFDFSLDGMPCGKGESTWAGWLIGVLGADRRLEFLRLHGIISDRQFGRLLETLQAVEEWSYPPVLNHGDLRLKNLLVDETGKILGMVDWERCVSAIGPHWDLGIALHDLGVDEKEAFLDGYGLSPDEVLRLVPVWRLFNALNYFPAVRRRVGSGSAEALARIRNRFRGALDLYAVGD